MKKILIFVSLILSLTSCDLAFYESGPPTHTTYQDTFIYKTVTCDDMFIYNSQAYVKKSVKLPATIYNPNYYSIIITYDELQFTIISHESITIGDLQ